MNEVVDRKWSDRCNKSTPIVSIQLLLVEFDMDCELWILFCLSLSFYECIYIRVCHKVWPLSFTAGRRRLQSLQASQVQTRPPCCYWLYLAPVSATTPPHLLTRLNPIHIFKSNCSGAIRWTGRRNKEIISWRIN